MLSIDHSFARCQHITHQAWHACSFNLEHITLRLTQLAAGLWQKHFQYKVPRDGALMVAECLSSTLGAERRNLLGVFQMILTSSSTLVPDEEQRALSQSADAWEVVLHSCEVLPPCLSHCCRFDRFSRLLHLKGARRNKAFPCALQNSRSTICASRSDTALLCVLLPAMEDFCTLGTGSMMFCALNEWCSWRHAGPAQAGREASPM